MVVTASSPPPQQQQLHSQSSPDPSSASPLAADIILNTLHTAQTEQHGPANQVSTVACADLVPCPSPHLVRCQQPLPAPVEPPTADTGSAPEQVSKPSAFARRGRKRRMMDPHAAEQRPCTEPDPEDRDGTHEDEVCATAEMDDAEDEVCSREREADVSRQVLELSLDSPPSLAKRSRITPPSSESSPEFAARQPDAVSDMVAELRNLLSYVASKPLLRNGSASFMRDYLRTLVAKSSSDAVAYLTSDSDSAVNQTNLFAPLPEELTRHVFSFLDGADLARSSNVCRLWNTIASEQFQWKKLCLDKWKSLDTDKALWRLIDRTIHPEDPERWRKIYPAIMNRPQWKCRLQKTGRFICMMKAFHIRGGPLGENGLPKALVVERRFNWSHLVTFVLRDASVLYYEPDTEKDSLGFRDFTEYLVKRTRAGLALEDDRRYIFIPPCEFSQSLDYDGPSLLGIAQSSIPQTQ